MLIERTPEDLSALIIRGINTPGVRESHMSFISRDPFGGYAACAVGMAYIAMVGDAEKAHYTYYSSVRIGFSPIKFFARELGIPPELVSKVSNMHCAGDMPAAKIARTISPWTIVEKPSNHEWVENKTESEKPSLFQRLKDWLGFSNRPQLRLITNP